MSEVKKTEEVKKPAAKKVAAKAEAIATDVKEVKAAEVKAEVKEVKKAVKTTKTTKAAKAPKAETKTAAKTTKAAKASVSTAVVIQFNGEENNLEVVKERVAEAWSAETGKKVSDIKDCKIYIKPQDKAAYYVVDGYTGRVDLF